MKNHTTENKKRMLRVYEILRNRTDEEHPITVAEIISLFENDGFTVDRRSIYDDIRVLSEYGADIVTVRKKHFYYYLASREFELAELKLLVDAVQASKFITQAKSESLIGKLEKLANRYQAEQLNRQVYILDRVKTENERIFYNIDEIYRGIGLNRKIRFIYYEYSLEKELVARRGGEYYSVSPIMMVWDDDRYYLVALDDRSGEIRHYRVDRMSDISVLEKQKADTKSVSASEYARKVFGMYPGDESYVDVCFDNSLIGVVIDRFGRDVPVRKTDESHFSARLHVSVSSTFFAWLFQFGEKARITGPAAVVRGMKEMTEKVAGMYCEKKSCR